MATIDYDITKYQPVLFAAESMDHLVDAVGSFFSSCDDDTLTRLEREHARAA
jgi:phenylalanine-4-hydroxylase